MTDTTDLVERLRLRIRQDEGDASFLTAIPPKFLYREAADAIERLTRERDEALAEVALSEKSYEEAYGEAYDEGLQEGLSGAASAASDLWSMLLRHFHKYGVEPASDDGEGYSAYQMMDALHEHEHEIRAAAEARITKLEETLKDIARQKLIAEMDDPYMGCFEEGYEACILNARDVLDEMVKLSQEMKL